MNEIVNKFLLVGDKFIPEMHLTQFRWAFPGLLKDWGQKVAALHKICHIYPIMMKLGRVIRYLKKIQTIKDLCETSTDFS